jgi:hypothetical protein
MLALLAALGLAAPVHAADAPLFEIVSRKTIYPASFVPVTPAAKQVAPLALVIESGTGWEAPGLLDKVLGKASAFFARCGVTLGETEVVSARWSKEGLRLLNVADPYKAPAEASVMPEPMIPARRPVGFFFAKGSIPSTAKAYNVSSTNVFNQRFPEAAAMSDTFWITYDEGFRPPKPDTAPSYSMMAHELAHIFGDIGHTREHPNLMTDDESAGAKSGDLTDAQCAAIRALR